MMDKLRAALLGLPRRKKRALQVVVDLLLVWCALWMSFIVRLGFEDAGNPMLSHPWLFAAAPLIAIPRSSASACIELSCVISATTP